MAGASLTLVEAVNQALAWEMAHDDSVVVFGEDVGLNGGVFRATVDLQEKFGAERVFDTPLAEAMIAGLSVGMATQGFKPVPEIQFMGFIYPALDQIISHASRIRNRTRGRLTCPMVLRAPFGTGIRAPEHHSESTEALFAHMPAVRVVIPSSPVRAYGLLLSAIRDPDPVVFLEPKRIYRAFRQEVPDNGEGLPLDKAFVTRPGTDVTLINWGASALESWTAGRRTGRRGHRLRGGGPGHGKPHGQGHDPGVGVAHRTRGHRSRGRGERRAGRGSGRDPGFGGFVQPGSAGGPGGRLRCRTAAGADGIRLYSQRSADQGRRARVHGGLIER